jgi:succinate dehydrogenase hydrophobic anchor subunit
MLKTFQFNEFINSDINENNQNYFCHVESMCRLNSKGFDSGVDNTILGMQYIYKDYLEKYPNFTINDLKNLFMSDESIKIHQQVEAIFWKISDEFSQYILDDMNLIIDNVNNSIFLLSIISLIFNIVLVIYILFGFLTILKEYYKDFDYSCKKISRAIYV